MNERIINGIKDDYKNNIPLSDISKKWKISRWAIYYYLHENNVKLKRPRLKKEIIKSALIDYRNKKLLLEEIARKWKISICTLYYYIKKFNVPRRLKKNYTQKEIKKTIKYYDSGLKVRDIAKLTGLTPDVVYDLLKKAGKKFNRLNKLRDFSKKIAEEYKSGISFRKFGRKYNVSPTTIRRLLKKLKIRFRNHKEGAKLTRKSVLPQKGINKNKSLLIGLLLADGSEAHNGINFASCDNSLRSYVIKLVKKIYGVEGKDDGKTRVRWYSKEILDDLHKYLPTLIHKPSAHTHVPTSIIKSIEFSKSFLRGFFSCDGSVVLTINKDGYLRREISLFCANTRLFDDICRMLRKLKIPYKSHKKYNIISICSKDGIVKFKEKIGLLPVKINGKRWKGFTKNELLELVVLTFSQDLKRRFKSYEKLKRWYKKFKNFGW
jgi:predicted DNA-binding protein YlxM (UPF0122 family)